VDILGCISVNTPLPVILEEQAILQDANSRDQAQQFEENFLNLIAVANTVWGILLKEKKTSDYIIPA
jgi:hypothetical protein